MRTLVCCLFLATFYANVSAQADDLQGFSNSQLQAALAKAGMATQRLYSVQTFGAGEFARPAYMAVLSGSRSGWHIAVFHRVENGFALDWVARTLPNEFSVASPSNFTVGKVGDDATVMFSGCAPHRCGGDYEGFLLYSTDRKEAFSALMTQDEDKPMRITFSKNALEERNQSYKEALQRAVDDVIRKTTFK